MPAFAGRTLTRTNFAGKPEAPRFQDLGALGGNRTQERHTPYAKNSNVWWVLSIRSAQTFSV
jgi:hypothetical protein